MTETTWAIIPQTYIPLNINPPEMATDLDTNVKINTVSLCPEKYQLNHTGLYMHICTFSEVLLCWW